MAVIDHERFPHIVDCIIKHAKPGTLFAFRGTSTQYRGKVDALLRHVAVDATEEIPGALRHLRVFSRCGALETVFPRMSMFHMRPGQLEDFVADYRAQLEPFLARAAVLDLQGPLTFNLPPAARGARRDDAFAHMHLDAPYPDARVLRVLGDHLGRLPVIEHISAKTVVFFAGAAAPEPGEKAPLMNRVQAPPGAEKIVVNIPICGRRFWKQEGHVYLEVARGAGVSLRDVVFVFQEVDEEGRLKARRTEYHPTNRRRADMADYDDDDGWLNICESLEEVLRTAQPRITFVGLPAKFYMGEALVDPAACLRQHIEELTSERAMWDFVDQRVRFVSWQEYRTWPNAQLETEMPEWPRHLPRSIEDGLTKWNNPLYPTGWFESPLTRDFDPWTGRRFSDGGANEDWSDDEDEDVNWSSDEDDL